MGTFPGGHSQYILVGVCHSTSKKGGLRHGYNPKRGGGVLGTGTTQKRGDLRHGHKSKKGGLRRGYNPKNGGLWHGHKSKKGGLRHGYK